MICPNCGTLIEDSCPVCPACHHRLDRGQSSNDDSVRWCESCGSPIPYARDACPECGLPVEGAFDDDGERFSVEKGSATAESLKEDEAKRLVSAVPPTPKSGESPAASDSGHGRKRLIMASALAALLLVGGTTLYITRPWDPNAYVTHTTVEADTSMEGFPGEKGHLSSQDRIEETRQQAINEQLGETLAKDKERLSAIADSMDACHGDLVEYLDKGQLPDGRDLDASMQSVGDELSALREEVDKLDIKDAQLADRREKMHVLFEYLAGAKNVLSDAWSAAKRDNGSLAAILEARTALAGGVDSRGYDEWIQLFRNAYAS